MNNVIKALSGTRMVGTPVITRNLMLPNDTTFDVSTPGQLITGMQVKLLGDNSKFIPSDSNGSLWTITKGDPNYDEYLLRYRQDFNALKANGNVQYRNSFPRAMYDAFKSMKPSYKQGSVINYLEYAK